MIEFLSKVFTDRTYLLKKVDEEVKNCKSIFVSGDNLSGKSEYFLLIQPSSEDIGTFMENLLENRLDWYVNRLQATDPAFKKNCTLILCIIQSEELDPVKIKAFEEDPYVFKKNVLVYNTKQLENLNLEIGKSEFTNQFASDLVFKDEGAVFETFKNNSINKDSFYPLLMMILAKLPIITYHRKESSQLYSLDNSINEKLNKEQLTIRNNCLKSDVSKMDDKAVEQMVTGWGVEK